jgi:hypothetical protein
MFQTTNQISKSSTYWFLSIFQTLKINQLVGFPGLRKNVGFSEKKTGFPNSWMVYFHGKSHLKMDDWGYCNQDG